MNLRKSYACLGLSLLIASSVPSSADILLVNAEGTGQYPTIQAAVDAAMDGDEVHFVAGMYESEGNRDVNFRGKAITIRSEDLDPTSVFVCSFILDSGEGPSSVIQALTFHPFNCYPDNALVFCQGTSPTIRDCTFSDNYDLTMFRNSAVGTPTLDGCRFIGNYVDDGRLFVFVAHGLVTLCLFQDNSVYNWGGGLISWDSVIEDCIFIGNVAGQGGGAIDGSGTIRRCLFIENQQPISITGDSTLESCTFVKNDSGLPGVVLVKGGSLSITNSILAYNNVSGPPIQGVLSSISCMDIFGNVGGDWEGDLAQYLGQNGNISADPLFCNIDPGNYRTDYYLYANSPCAPTHSNGCGLMGLYDVGCEPSSVEAKSWGKIKGMYR